jgi:hypothetical protein
LIGCRLGEVWYFYAMISDRLEYITFDLLGPKSSNFHFSFKLFHFHLNPSVAKRITRAFQMRLQHCPKAAS